MRPVTLSLLLLAACLPAGSQTAPWRILEKGSVALRVSADYPLVLEYRRGDAVFEGADPQSRWKATLLRPDGSDLVLPLEATLLPLPAGGTRADYALVSHLEDRKVLELRAGIALEENQADIRLTDVRTASGFTLRQVDFGKALRVGLPWRTPKATVCGGTLGRDPGAYFLEDSDHLRARDARPVDMAMVCGGGAVAVGYNNLVLHPWRVSTDTRDAMAEFWCPPYVRTVVAGKPGSADTATMPDFVCRVGLLADYSRDGEVDWQDGAAFIRDQLPGGVPLFQDYTRYEAGEDFDAFIDVARRIYHITDGRPQLCLHAAWQYWGWDSEYPAYMEPNDELGGRPALYRLMREAPKVRCLVSLIHNFDDSYRHSPAWDERIILRHGDGSLVEATAWAGGRSYINGPYRMVKLGWARKVIDGLVAQGARVRLFSDVLSAVPERVDEDPSLPSDALANLVLGKFRILEMLKTRGITLGSESVTWPFVGRLCTAHSMPLGISEDPTEVPLGPFVLHGKMAYQAWSAGPQTLLAGVDNTTGWDNDRLFLWSMVLEQYAGRPMTRYARGGGLFRTEFGPGTFVEWRKGEKTARVIVDGRLISNGVSSFLPKKTPDVFLAYSRSAEPQRYPRPKGWDDPSRLRVYRLSTGPEEKADAARVARLEGDEIVLTLEAGTPYRLCYGEEAYEADRKVRETPFDPPAITWPEDRLLSATPEGPRPGWIRKSTRTDPPGATLIVGCGAKYPTEEESRRHAASIVARKLAWQVRQGFVNRSRDYERRLGLDTGKLGFDNWNLGVDEPLALYSLERIDQRPGTRWYLEKLEDRNPQLPKPREAYKAFVAVPVTPKDLHDLYLEAIRNHLEEARKALESGSGNRDQLQSRVKLWSLMLEEESKRED